MAIWDAIKELERLQRKAAKGKDIEDKDTFIVRAALKEKGWEGLVCEEAISRGYREFRGEEVTSIPSWYVEEAISRFEENESEEETSGTDYDYMLDTPEVQGDEAPEEEHKAPGRVFNLLGDLGGEEPQEQEEVRKEELEINEKEEVIPAGQPGMGMPPSGIALTLRKEEVMENEVKTTVHTPGRQRVYVGDEIGWLCKICNRVWGLEEETCSVCDGEPGYEDLYPAAKQAADKIIAETLGRKKSDKELAIDAMFKALGIEPEYRPDLKVEVREGAVQCDTCSADDYLECDCCIECETEDCVCCDNCARFPCQCDKEECPICHAEIPIAEACPHGCDSDIKELLQLYEEVKNSKELNFSEKIKFMSLLKEKMSLAEDEDPREINVTQNEDEEWEEVEEDNNE